VGSHPGRRNWRRFAPTGDTQVGASATFYLIGAVTGALLFGYLTDLLGRKKLFMVTLLLYLISTALTAFSWNL
jgi:MFS family permease